MAIDRLKKQQAFAAASRRFPGFELPIRRLIENDETFLEICDGLAEAELALSRVANDAPSPVRSARRSEWEDLVDRLIEEVGAALRSDTPARH
jgi:hypothetical protein